MCGSFQRNESAFHSGILNYSRKQAFSIQAENEQLLASLQLHHWVCQRMGKRKWLHKKLAPSQGEAKRFVFITKSHRKEMQNTKEPKANGEIHIQPEDFLRVNVCFYPSALRSAWIYVNTISRAVPKYSVPDNLWVRGFLQLLICPEPALPLSPCTPGKSLQHLQ